MNIIGSDRNTNIGGFMWKFKELIRDKTFRRWALSIILTIPTSVSTFISFLDLDARCRLIILLILVGLSLVIIIVQFIRLLFMNNITLNLNGSEVEIKKVIFLKCQEIIIKSLHLMSILTLK